MVPASHRAEMTAKPRLEGQVHQCRIRLTGAVVANEAFPTLFAFVEREELNPRDEVYDDFFLNHRPDREPA